MVGEGQRNLATAGDLGEHGDALACGGSALLPALAYRVGPGQFVGHDRDSDVELGEVGEDLHPAFEVVARGSNSVPATMASICLYPNTTPAGARATLAVIVLTCRATIFLIGGAGGSASVSVVKWTGPAMASTS